MGGDQRDRAARRPAPHIPIAMRIGPVEGRIIGSLIEKQLATPAQYPLTLNSLLSACNQSSNRDPVVSYDERTLDAALVSLKEAGLVRFVHPSHGRSVIRYRQVLDEKLGLDELRLALVGVLLLRGPQTVGELRARTERMARFDGIAAVEADLEALTRGSDPLVLRLPRRPGQKEERWVQLLSGHTETASGSHPDDGYERPYERESRDDGYTSRQSAVSQPSAPNPPNPPDTPNATNALTAPTAHAGRITDGTSSLAGEVASLQADLASVRAELASVSAELASVRGELSNLRADLDELREVWADS